MQTAKPIPPANAVKKREIVAVRVNRSYTLANLKTVREEKWTLAHVDHATRDGTAKQIRFAGTNLVGLVGRLCQVWAIKHHVDAAERLAASFPRAGTAYQTQAELRDAILACAA